MNMRLKQVATQRWLKSTDVKILFIGWIVCASANAAHSADVTPLEYRALLIALGQQNYARADSFIKVLLQQPELYPTLFETAAMRFVYPQQWARGQAFFDSLYAIKKYHSEAAAALAMLHHHKHDTLVSYQYLEIALNAGCQTLRSYELFVGKSFELDTSVSALRFLTQRAQRYPENWRYRYALGLWHYSNRHPEITLEMMRQLLAQGHKHWRVFAGLGSSLTYLGQHHEALATYQNGMQYCEENLDDEGRIRMWHGLAEAQFALGKTEESKQALRQAESLAKQLDCQIFFCRLDVMSSRILMNEQQWLAARERLETAQKQARQFAEGNTLLRSYYYMMNLERLLGRWEAAAENTLKTSAIAHELGLEAYSVELLSIIGTIDLEAGNYEKALGRFMDMDSIVRADGTKLQRVPYLLGAVKSLLVLERYEEALPLIADGLQLAKESGNLTQIIEFKNSQAAIWLHSGKLTEARILLQETSAAVLNAKQKTEWFETNVLLAQIDLRADEVAAAQKKLLRLIAEFTETPPYNSYLQIMACLAETYVRQNNLARARAIYHSTANVIASQTQMRNPGSLSGLAKGERAIFFGLSQVYLRGGDSLQALAVTEKAHDLVVRRKLIQARLLEQANLDEQQRQQLAGLDSLLLAARIQQATEQAPSENLQLEGQIRRLEQQRDAILNGILPPHAVLTFDRSDFPLEDFQRMLRERKELAIKFFLGASQSLVFFLNGDKFEAKEIAVGHADLQLLLARINTLFTTTPGLRNTSPLAGLDTLAAFEAYKTLLADWLQHSQATRLAIVPDDVLHAMPFDLLVTTSRAQPVEFLMQRFTIRNGISFASLQQEAEPRWLVQSVLMVANPTLRITEDRADTTQRPGSVFLPAGEKELRAVEKIIRIKHLLTGDEANKRQFFPLLQVCDWLHFASHSVSRPGEPLYAELILALLKQQFEPERAYAFEIFQMHLRIKLAILSGCETARGAFFNGEGFEGFVQAFRAAGTPSVIASLWKVEDHASAQFFEFYYEALMRGQSTSTALQTAKLKMLADTRYSVLDWAAFNYYGHDWKVELPQAGIPNSHIIMLMLAVVALSGILIFYYRRRPAKA